jgi:hypothetical protein
MTIKKLKLFKKFLILSFNLTLYLLSFTFYSFAQDNKLVTLTKQVIEAKTPEELYTTFEGLKELYFSENKYNEFIDFLKSLADKKKDASYYINYYIALSRYQQLKYLEEKQLWDDYFARGNTYREELASACQKAIETTKVEDSLNIYARLLLWQFYKDQNDTSSQQALQDLMDSVYAYSITAKDITPIKVIADKLASYKELTESKRLYKIYADKIAASDVKEEEFLSKAQDFYEESNLELAQILYDIYIERITKTRPQEEFMPLLFDIANLFTYKAKGVNDAFYAEKIFERIEGIAGKDVFEEEQLYLRAFNLEKIKEYQKAKDNYVDLLSRFPNTKYADQIYYKLGIIYTYIIGDIKTGKDYFERLALRHFDYAQVISGLYQLGLLNQWEGDLVMAGDYYHKLIERAGDGFIETVSLAKERLKEIEEERPIEYNLKTLLDISLKEEKVMFVMTKVNLTVNPYKAGINEEITINSTAYTEVSGCFPVELQFLWSGHLGKIEPSLDQSAIATSYISPGTKEINLVVVSPSGIVDRAIDLVDIH